MGNINVLSFEIANLIAAGEVVERPSSVLKELIENSIDSGATEIVAEIKRGGVALIRVSDNGCGIEKDDLPVALKRHATSKIKSRDDLNSIVTLGFRGEALSAIAAVSELTLISKTKSAECATMLTAEAGKVVDISEVGAADGTTVVVENLFYNVPARRKFLKKDATEAMNVTALVEKVALSRPDISIQLLVDGEQKFRTPGTNQLLDTIYSVFGKDFASKMIKAEGVANSIKVHGYIGRSDNVKKNRNMINVFINGRYVKSQTVMAAIEKAYTSYIAPECFPACVLFLEMNPTIVDVNVHPAKLEVKFSDERVIFEAVYYTIRTALEKHEYRPELTLPQKKTNERNYVGAFVPIGKDTKGMQLRVTPEVTYTAHKTSEYKPERPITFASIGRNHSAGSYREPERLTPKDSVELLERYRDAMPSETKRESTISKSPKEIPAVTVAPTHKIIGEAFDCYVMVEYEGALLIIDKHAAHERIIFEDLKKTRENDGRVGSQALLLPITVMLTPDEISAAIDFAEEISAVGFEYSINGKGADIVAIPDAISAASAEELFLQMVDEVNEGRGNPAVTESIRREKVLYQIACKAAIKGGRIYDKSVIDWLVGRVLQLPDITVCPHGRPIAYKLTKSELDRQFERIK